ncbi:hypothetical protein Pyn_18505 [Prunus yedoensis var. nudiflora]|uniref:Protein kinase domain-containing protein n=1 Tax=Prunus yedoensis var. nudiflora TaxID=2094558 RepID=A0A314Y4L4_PRUYE|nr:hypothetical protein Pyn_18505 [Prunus yedoensis var. nudiflora]
MTILLLWRISTPAAEPDQLGPIAKPSCETHCGDVSIPYPFGIGPSSSCYLYDWFEIHCDNSTSPHKPFLRVAKLEVLNISIEGTLLVKNPVTFFFNRRKTPQAPNLTGSPILYSQKYNRFTAVSCGFFALVRSYRDERVVGGCMSTCDKSAETGHNHGCNGINCCYYKPKPPLLSRAYRIRTVLLGLGAGLGLLLLLIGGAWLGYRFLKKRHTIKRREMFFKLKLEKQISSGEVNVEKIKLFKSKELEKSTDNFNIDRILGQGGQGTVYKGMQTDGRIVAVKKSKRVDESQFSEFINEVVILSQINHRNVVQLLGCCLETEVPILVYEFIPNGNLSHYIHEQNEEFPLTWEVRLRIAMEIAGALSYLHASASPPIYHRDIKSTNILLDTKYRAKVADFGTSRSVAIDQTHLTTLVHGTFGYLDPEYFQSSQFTEKSDVYSFGVVLVELLTGLQPVIAVTGSQEKEHRSLATCFIISMEEDRLFDILDARVVMEGSKTDITTFANLAKRCLDLNGRNRPTMREVTAELEAISMLVEKSSNAQHNYNGVQSAMNDTNEYLDVVSCSTESASDAGTNSTSDEF